MPGVDIHLYAHADSQRWLAGSIADTDTHRNALDDLDPVSAGILRRQPGKARCGCRTYAFDGADPSLTWKSIDLDRHFLSRLDVGQFGFLRARLNPDVIGRDAVECRRRSGKILAG